MKIVVLFLILSFFLFQEASPRSASKKSSNYSSENSDFNIKKSIHNRKYKHLANLLDNKNHDKNDVNDVSELSEESDNNSLLDDELEKIKQRILDVLGLRTVPRKELVSFMQKIDWNPFFQIC